MSRQPRGDDAAGRSPVDVDVLVVGAGPAGLAAAIEARLAGMSVAVVDPRGAPIDKACGEGLMPAAAASLERLGVHVAGRPFHGVRYCSPRRSVTARFRRGAALGVRRTELSRGMSERAAELGVDRVRARAGSPVQGPDWVEAAGVRARWLLAADGLHSPTRRALGLQVRGRGPVRYGLRRHYAVAPWADVVEVHWSRTAEAYVTPVADDTVGVAVLSSGGRSFDDRLAEFPALVAQLADAGHASTVRGAGPLRQRATRTACARVLLVGDAAGYVDALTGEGIAVGLASAREAVAAIAAGDPGSYERRWRSATRRYRLLTQGLLAAATQPVLRAGIVPAAQRLPAVFARVVDALA